LRIVSWNMERQGNDTWAFLLENLNPDVALIQEAILPKDGIDGYDVLWTSALPSGRWGSGILARFGKLDLEWEDRRRGAVVMGRCTIPSLGPVSIVSLHARVNRHTHLVIPDLRETLAHVRPRLEPRFILGGDLNTAREAGRRWPNNGHVEFWRDIETWGLSDCHYLVHGVERQSFWRGALRYRPAAIDGLQDDHIFVDAKTFRAVNQCFVWDTEEVRALSDHGPLVVELALGDEDGRPE
jgi:exonuclease III